MCYAVMAGCSRLRATACLYELEGRNLTTQICRAGHHMYASLPTSIEGIGKPTFAPSCEYNTQDELFFLRSRPDATVVQFCGQHLSRYSRYYSGILNAANFDLQIRSGPLFIEVTTSGEKVDGVASARQPESSVASGRFKLAFAIG
jgi:hypothetical protein